jgi:hypothetical protein
MAELNTTAAPLTGTKSMFTSKTVIAGVVTAVLGLLGAFHLAPAGLDGTVLVDAIFTILGVVSAIGRIVATKKIG